MKRFIDDKIWLDPWFNKLDTNEKLFWIYLFTNCSKIGEWEENREEVEYRLKKKVDWIKWRERFSEKVVILDPFWYIKNYIATQYPNLLKLPDSPLHISVFKELDRKCLKLLGNSLSIDYGYTIDSLRVKVMVKEEVKDKVKEEENKELSPFENAFSSFEEMRKKLKKPLTENAKTLIKSKLSELAPGNIETQIKILEQSIMYCYQGVFPLKENGHGNNGKGSVGYNVGNRHSGGSTEYPESN